jgi:alpha-galactosidase
MYKIAMIGGGSPGFSYAIAEGLVNSEILSDATFTLMDIDRKRLDASEKKIKELVETKKSGLKVNSTTDRKKALEGADFIVTSCEINRVPFWIQDIEIPERYGVYQLKGENGGPGGQIHALRNITLFMDICKDIREVSPNAWLMNFTNPVSFLCTYFQRYGGVKYLGFCHQVHGSFGVIAEMLDMEPGDLQVITGGVNHFNWLIDIRKKNSSESYLKEFLQSVRESVYWKKNYKNVPHQKFTLQVLDVFGSYPVGYDDHIVEYIPFFYEKKEWQKMGYHSEKYELKEFLRKQKDKGIIGELKTEKPPFPRNLEDPYYREGPVSVAESLLTNKPLYLDAINIVNNGSIHNLPTDAIVDIPAVVIGGRARGIDVGKLPEGCAELCRRQITIHSLIVEAAVKGDRRLALQAMCLDPYIKSITQAKSILNDYLTTYRRYLPQFFHK